LKSLTLGQFVTFGVWGIRQSYFSSTLTEWREGRLRDLVDSCGAMCILILKLFWMG